MYSRSAALVTPPHSTMAMNERTCFRLMDISCRTDIIISKHYALDKGLVSAEFLSHNEFHSRSDKVKSYAIPILLCVDCAGLSCLRKRPCPNAADIGVRRQ